MTDSNLRRAAAGAGGDYAIDYSCQFIEADNTHMTYIPSLTPSSVRIGSLGVWFKIGNQVASTYILKQIRGDDDRADPMDNAITLVLNEDGTVQFTMEREVQGSTHGMPLISRETTRQLRDPHAWYHFWATWDTNQDDDTACSIYINGVQETAFANSKVNPPSGGENTEWLNNVFPVYLCKHHKWNYTYNFDGYISQLYVQDGVTGAATDSGEFDNNGIWRPIDASGLEDGFGNNGFFLDFADSAHLGKNIDQTGTWSSFSANTSWTGATGAYSFSAGRMDHPKPTHGAANRAVKSTQTFTGDFSLRLRIQSFTSSSDDITFGVYDIAEDSTFSNTSHDGALVSMTNSIHFHIGKITPAFNAYGGSTEEESNINGQPAEGDRYELRRVINPSTGVGVFTVYENGSLARTMTKTFDEEVRMMMGGGNTHVVDSIEWLDGDGTGNFENNFLQYAMSTNDRVSDSPTNNWCVGSPIWRPANTTEGAVPTLSDGNLQISYRDNNNASTLGSISIPGSGKWYWEWTIDAGGNNSNYQVSSGIVDLDAWGGGISTGITGANIGELVYWSYSQLLKEDDGSTVEDYSSATSAPGPGNNTDILAIALDLDNGAFYVRVEGTWLDDAQNVTGAPESGTSKTGAGATWTPGTKYNNVGIVLTVDGGLFPIGTWNFGQRAFRDSAPIGYSTINTTNLPAPTIKDPSLHFQANIRTGNATDVDADPSDTLPVAQTGNSQFGTDLISIKNRGTTDEWKVVDRVRTATKELNWDSTAVETTDAAGVTAFSATDGYTIGIGANGYNDEGEAFIDYHWKADGTTGSSNTDGAITSNVAANITAGFSIVTYTGTGSAATVGHGLTSAPDIVLVKELTDDVGAWQIQHSSNTNAPETEQLLLNTQDATTDDDTPWNDVAPTDTVFTVGTHDDVNGSSDTYVAYCWHAVAGFSSFGTYEGNNDVDGTVILTGFSPALVICKNIDTASGGDWWTVDSARDTYNPADLELLLNSIAQAGEDVDMSAPMLDFLSNGFKMRCTGAGSPNSRVSAATPHTFVYMAWAKNPFGGRGRGTASGVTPATAR